MTNDGGSGENRRIVRHRGKHHQVVPQPPRPHPWPDAAVAQAVGRLHHRNGTAPAVRPQPQHVLHAGPPASMCYTTNEVLVIIAVTCFLNFAFILLVMTCVHCFTDPSHHKKFGAVAYAELGDEQLFDADIVDGDTVTLLNPTKWPPDSGDCSWRGDRTADGCEYDPESCAPYQSLIAAHDRRPRRKSGRRSEDDPGLFLFE